MRSGILSMFEKMIILKGQDDQCLVEQNFRLEEPELTCYYLHISLLFEFSLYAMKVLH